MVAQTCNLREAEMGTSQGQGLPELLRKFSLSGKWGKWKEGNGGKEVWLWEAEGGKSGNTYSMFSEWETLEPRGCTLGPCNTWPYTEGWNIKLLSNGVIRYLNIVFPPLPPPVSLRHPFSLIPFFPRQTLIVMCFPTLISHREGMCCPCSLDSPRDCCISFLS